MDEELTRHCYICKINDYDVDNRENYSYNGSNASYEESDVESDNDDNINTITIRYSNGIVTNNGTVINGLMINGNLISGDGLIPNNGLITGYINTDNNTTNNTVSETRELIQLFRTSTGEGSFICNNCIDDIGGAVCSECGFYNTDVCSHCDVCDKCLEENTLDFFVKCPDDFSCPICMCNDILSEILYVKCPECKVIIHYNCITEWLKQNNTCICCRSDVWKFLDH